MKRSSFLIFEALKKSIFVRKNLRGCLSVGNKNGIGRSAWIERKNFSQIGQLVEHIFSKFNMVKMNIL